MIPTGAKWALAIALLCAAFAFGWWVRGLKAGAVDSRALAARAIQAETVQRQQDVATAEVDASGAAREDRQRVVYRTIHDQVIRYVEHKDSSSGSTDCMLDAEWVRLHDAAAVGELSDAAGAGHGAGPQAGDHR
jgi:hypothetical protein